MPPTKQESPVLFQVAVTFSIAFRVIAAAATGHLVVIRRADGKVATPWCLVFQFSALRLPDRVEVEDTAAVPAAATLCPGLPAAFGPVIPLNQVRIGPEVLFCLML